ncbi:MAG: ATP synthase F1 subunit gamma [Deltaproteobacteria bacterium]|nr:ATP synthase F1 subunit gamma [Deltaproteobacteria bacterium]MBI3293752.1 ATP synthase F1 subunit gamma [Deltaproteobacteria bacterium]
MASLKDIRKRIGSVKSTRQITRAMKMVAAAKLRRAQEAILNARPYAYRIYAVLLSLAKREGVSHPLLVERSEKRIRLIVIAGDRGLCGSFNTTILKAAQEFQKKKLAEGVEVVVEAVGRKASDFFKKRGGIAASFENILSKPRYQAVSEIAQSSLKAFAEGQADAVYVAYNEFKSAMQQNAIVERLIPVSSETPEGVVGIFQAAEGDRFKKYIFEPGVQELLNEIIPRHFSMQFFRAVLESVASEHGARMSAMENATKNASEMIDGLTLEYNKARQASITKELMEIVGGVEAMR